MREFMSLSMLAGYATQLAKKILDSGFKPDVLCLLGNGGLVGGYFLAKILNVPVCVINVKSYTDKKQGDVCVFEKDLINFPFIHTKKNILLFDDLVDTGKTVETVRSYFNENQHVKVATIYKKENTSIVPDYYCLEGGNAWIVFEYEVFVGEG